MTLKVGQGQDLPPFNRPYISSY